MTFSSPANGSTTSESSTYIIGMSDPYYMLTMNGERVGRTKSGYFSVYVNLEPGVNEIVFEQNGIRYLYTITRTIFTGEAPSENEPAQETPDRVIDTLSVTGTYPSKAVATSGSELWVSCVAAADSEVEVDIGGVVTKLPPLETPKNKTAENGYIAVIYGANAKLPEASAGEVLDAGTVSYTAKHASGTVTAEGIPVRILGEDAPLAVRVKEDYTHLKITESSSYYNDYTVQSAGMTDYAVSQRNGFYQLRMGGYVAETDVEETDDYPTAGLTVLSSAEVKNAGAVTEFRLGCVDRPAYNGCIEEDGRFVVTFYNIDAESAPEVKIGDNPLIQSCEVVRLEKKVRYAFTLYDTRNFYGFDLYYEDGAVVVSLNNPVKLDLSAEQPLTGIRIVLDAGHGGTDTGAPGAYENGEERIIEKDLNLSITLETAELLKSLGAEVELMREEDVTVPLTDRMAYLEESEPDLCISIHQNSVGYTTDATRVRGTLALWCMDSGRLLADCVGPAVADALGRNFRGSNYQALAMCRNPKFPQVLIEVGFITSVEEYEKMVNGDGVRKAAEGVRDGVMEYFARQAEYLG